MPLEKQRAEHCHWLSTLLSLATLLFHCFITLKGLYQPIGIITLSLSSSAQANSDNLQWYNCIETGAQQGMYFGRYQNFLLKNKTIYGREEKRTSSNKLIIFFFFLVFAIDIITAPFKLMSTYLLRCVPRTKNNGIDLLNKG